VAAAAEARAEVVCQKESQSPVAASAAVAVAFITIHHCFKPLFKTQSTLIGPGSPHWK